jgi:hypothetical protein
LADSVNQAAQSGFFQLYHRPISLKCLEIGCGVLLTEANGENGEAKSLFALVFRLLIRDLHRE